LAELTALFPGIEKIRVDLPVRQLTGQSGSLPLRELTVLSAVCRYVKPRRVFEIGTFRGKSTLALAMHSPADCEVFTLDLPSPDVATQYPVEIGDIARQSYRIGEDYRGEFEHKVWQLLGDSAVFDFSPYRRSMNLVFVDGNHENLNVVSDTARSFELLTPRGVIIWDDYNPVWGPGVMRALEEKTEFPIFQIAGTRFAVFSPAFS